MTHDLTEQYRKAGPALGAYIGCLWITSFICMANTVVNPMLSILGMGIGIGSLAALVIMVYRFRQRICAGNLSFFRNWLLVLQTFFYASILMAFGVFLYMKFLDSGRFGAFYEQMLTDPATKDALAQILAGTGITGEEFVAQVTTISPINLAMNIMESSILMGFLLSFPLTLLCRIKAGAKPKKEA